MTSSADASGRRALTRLWLIRHGRVASAWTDRIYGRLDVPLSRAGERQAREAAERLAAEPLAAVVSSGLARTEYGAARLRRGRDLARRDEPDLAEIDRGEWAGVRFADLERDSPGALAAWCREPERIRPPGGENLADLAGRVLPRVQALVGEFGGGAVAVVAHSWVIRVALCAAVGLPPGAAQSFDPGPGSISAVDWPTPAGAERGLRPTLVGCGLNRPPDRSRGWFRGPHRG